MKTQEVVNVFLNLAADDSSRLARSQQLREHMHKVLEQGGQPGGYRAQWLKDSAMVIIDTLGDLAQDFDDSHCDDRCSANDLFDIMATAIGILKTGSEG